jgi:hypothetical protein
MMKATPFGLNEQTYHGYCTVVAGMLIHLCLGIVAIWGNIVIYITGKLRENSENLTIKFDLFIFPLTLAMGSLGMQLAFKLQTRITPRKQLVLGGIIYVGSIYLAHFAVTFLEFMFFYAILLGLGYGLLYFLPVECAWSYFP